MIVRLSEVPHGERHLLYCSQLLPRWRSKRHRNRRRRAIANMPPLADPQQTEEVCHFIPLAAGFDAAGTQIDVA